MKKLLFLFFLCFSSLVNANNSQDTTAVNDTTIHQGVDQRPEFVGGNTALYDYVAKNIHYPDSAKETGIQGKVFVSFIVEKNGSISNVNLMNSGGDKMLDDEAIRVIASMPPWLPGKKQGKEVRTKFVLPIIFRLK